MLYNCLVATLAGLPAVLAAVDLSGVTTTIQRDVVIIGGGASGAHAAFRLKNDYQKTVAIVEKQGNLGGHVDTYYDAEAKQYREYGVQVYFPFEDGMDFISRFNLTLVFGLGPRNTTVTKNVDFTTGKELVNYADPNADAISKAILDFYNLMVNNGWDKMVEPGYWALPPGPQIPADLLLSIGDFAKKYNLTAALPRMYQSVGGGAGSRFSGDLNKVLTLTILQSFSPSWMKVYFGAAGFFHIDGGNQQLYDRIATDLGNDSIFYNSTVVSSERTDAGVKVVVDGPHGKTLINAKKLLIAVPPTRENLAPLDLNADETTLFSKPSYGHYHTAIVKHPSLPRGVELRNMPTSAVQDPYSPFLKTPFVLSFSSYGNDSSLFSIGSSGSDYSHYDQDAAVQEAQGSLKNMANAGTIPPLGRNRLEVVEWSDHGPGGFGVTARDMAGGWMARLYGLQGSRSTFYTGNGLAVDFSTVLWKFNDILLPKITATL